MLKVELSSTRVRGRPVCGTDATIDHLGDLVFESWTDAAVPPPAQTEPARDDAQCLVVALAHKPLVTLAAGAARQRAFDTDPDLALVLALQHLSHELDFSSIEKIETWLGGHEIPCQRRRAGRV